MVLRSYREHIQEESYEINGLSVPLERRKGVALSSSLYEIVTAKVIESLKKGTVPWRKPWNVNTLLPCNATTNRPYRGVNILLLGLSPFADHRWLTFKQAQELGGKVKQGERSTMVVFWKFPERKQSEDDEDSWKQNAPILRYFNVFNVEQVEGIEVAPIPIQGNLTDEHRIGRADALVCSMPNPPFIEERGQQAWYHPESDMVRIPKVSSFSSIDEYYSTLFHELGHSTGHEKRLKRSGVAGKVHFGSEEYSREELVAELTSSFCCATVALDNSIHDNSVAYINSWMNSLRSDPKALVIAAAQAQKATDYIKGIEYPLNAKPPILATV